MNDNPLLRTDVYKLGHMRQYAPGVTKVYSYLTARSAKEFDQVMFFGLQYYLKQYLTQPLRVWMAADFISHHNRILGDTPADVRQKIYDLCNLGHWPIRIKAVPEGTVIPPKHVLMTITNTHPDFYWCVGFLESLLLKVWFPITVASHAYAYRGLITEMFRRTVDDDQQQALKFMVHDFGYRGDSSEESAGISGAAFLTAFTGSDDVIALPFVDDYYAGLPGDVGSPGEVIMQSVPASEHSVMCSFGREDELAAFRHMLDLYPTGIVSIVSDTFDVYRVLTEFAEQLKPQILARDGKCVFRPDSGNPEHIICGNPDAAYNSNEYKGCIRLLDEQFGSSRNAKGFSVLNPKVGLIYGDGMYLERYRRTLVRLEELGYAASNLVIGVGGILRNHSRDALGFAIKATYVEINGEGREIEKDPVTDHGKKSHKGLLCLTMNDDGHHTSEYCTEDQVTLPREQEGLLRTVFENGKLLNETSLREVRDLVDASLKGQA